MLIFETFPTFHQGPGNLIVAIPVVSTKFAIPSRKYIFQILGIIPIFFVELREVYPNHFYLCLFKYHEIPSIIRNGIIIQKPNNGSSVNVTTKLIISSQVNVTTSLTKNSLIVSLLIFIISLLSRNG